MSNRYEALLEELGISTDHNSFEICKLLKDKKNECKALMTSQNSKEENEKLEKKIHVIHEAENYFEKKVIEDKKNDRLDGFDYSSLKNNERKKRRQRVHITLNEPKDPGTEAQNEELSYEERYDNIIGFMGTPNGFEAGVEQLKQLGEEGYLPAQLRVANIYYCGEKSIGIDYDAAISWYEKAAGQGNTAAYGKLGCIYMKDNGVGPDREKAIYWLTKAAGQQDVAAYWNLGLLYEQYFEEKDYKKALYWYEKAAEQGYVDAQNKLGVRLTEEGEFEITDAKKNVFWCEKTVEPNDDMTQFYIASEYLKNQDYHKALYWLEKAAENHNKEAYFQLGTVYGYQLPQKDYDLAISWYEKGAAEYDDNLAMCCLGRIYETIMHDNSKAAQWYLKAIQYGNKEAQDYFTQLSKKEREK